MSIRFIFHPRAAIRSLCGLIVCIAVASTSARAAVIYSGLQDVPVPNDPAGVWFNIATGSTSPGEPLSWNTAPWMNLFFGGTAIGNDDLMIPVITGADQVLNLAMATMVDGTNTYPAGESGSSTHVGAGAGQFALGQEGLIGVRFQATAGGPVNYGWMRVVIENTGAGSILDWAYEGTSGVGIPAGFTGTLVVPEPARGLMLLAGAIAMLSRRRRHREARC